MIDENKLIEYINSLPDNSASFVWRSANKIKKELTSIIRHQPKISEWIPCSIQMPEEDTDVLICIPYDGVDIAYISDGNWRYTRGDELINTIKKANIIAWQPLPELYQET